jgi:pimeloyl-ACP methyl ester carboxylesterase
MPLFTARDGTRIRFEVAGEGHPLILIPGLGGSARVWGPFPRTLGAWFRAVAYDPRGFGGSAAPPAAITMDSMVSDVDDLLNALSVGRAHFFGISMGGIIAQRFAAERPDRVARLVLVSTTRRMTPWSRRVLDVLEIMARRLSPREFVKLMAAFSLSPGYFDSGPHRSADLETALLPAPGEMASLLAQIEALRSLDAAGGAPAVRAPTLILSGRRDFLTPPSAAEDLKASIENSRLVFLEGGHACLMENTDEGVVEVLSFLREPGPPE